MKMKTNKRINTILINLLQETFALNSVMAIFNNDAHTIISKKGREILNTKMHSTS